MPSTTNNNLISDLKHAHYFPAIKHCLINLTLPDGIILDATFLNLAPLLNNALHLIILTNGALGSNSSNNHSPDFANIDNNGDNITFVQNLTGICVDIAFIAPDITPVAWHALPQCIASGGRLVMLLFETPTEIQIHTWADKMAALGFLLVELTESTKEAQNTSCNALSFIHINKAI